MTEACADTTSQVLERARNAAIPWRNASVRDRLRIVRRTRQLLAAEAPVLAENLGELRPLSESLVAEVLPLAEACRFLEREAERLLAPRPLGRRGRPAWLRGVDAEIRREPCGVVLVLGPANYPLFLPGVQIVQALTAGNAVCAKPAPGRAAALTTFAALLRRAGLPPDILTILDDSQAAGEAACMAGFDRIVLTGSETTGKRVLRAVANQITPCTMELSGDDPVFILPGADLPLAAAAIAYGMRLNNGETCIAPRRIFIAADTAPAFTQMLGSLVANPLPVIPVRDADHALALAAKSRFALGAAIFGPEPDARALAGRVAAGCVVVNDVIVPTADPRLPFGGRKGSGFGVTRGAEGLLEMTVLKSVTVRQGRFRPHLDPADTSDSTVFAALIATLHGNGRTRMGGLAVLASQGKRLMGRRTRRNSLDH